MPINWIDESSRWVVQRLTDRRSIRRAPDSMSGIGSGSLTQIRLTARRRSRCEARRATQRPSEVAVARDSSMRGVAAEARSMDSGPRRRVSVCRTACRAHRARGRYWLPLPRVASSRLGLSHVGCDLRTGRPGLRVLPAVLDERRARSKLHEISDRRGGVAIDRH